MSATDVLANSRTVSELVQDFVDAYGKHQAALKQLWVYEKDARLIANEVYRRVWVARQVAPGSYEMPFTVIVRDCCVIMRDWHGGGNPAECIEVLPMLGGAA